MPRFLKHYVLVVEAASRRVGEAAMYLVFALMAILLYSAFSKAFLLPALWTLEMAQFTMVAYYLLGGRLLPTAGRACPHGSPILRKLVDRAPKFVIDSLHRFLFLIFYLGVFCSMAVCQQYAPMPSNRRRTQLLGRGAPYMCADQDYSSCLRVVFMMLLQAIAESCCK